MSCQFENTAYADEYGGQGETPVPHFYVVKKGRNLWSKI